MDESAESADLSDVPLFPLPNVVLFPHAILPLHIFEDRYRAMTADALTGRSRIAMALLRPGWETEYQAAPAIEPVVCVGSIVEHERLPDGRYNLLLNGRVRARVVREHSGRPWRRAELERIVETDVMEIDLTGERSRLIEAFANPRLAGTDIGRRFHRLLSGTTSTAAIADVVAFTFFEDVALKQSLLEQADVRSRVERTVRAFEAMLCPLRACDAAPTDRPGLN